MALLTILTATWNRRNLLERLHASLCAQAVPPDTFEWLVIDDGSTDGTEDYISRLAADSPFSIRVIRQQNGGKHRALNRGALALRTPWVLVVDSDDALLPHGLEQAFKEIAIADENSSTLAIIAPRRILGRPNAQFKPTSSTINFARWMQQKNVGDTSIIVRCSVIIACPFPEFNQEIFIAESSAYAKMFQEGGIYLSNNQIIFGEYHRGGLSSNSITLRAQAPLGALFTYKAHLSAGITGCLKIRDSLNYHRFYWHARARGLRPETSGFTADPFWLCLGAVLYFKDRLALASYIR